MIQGSLPAAALLAALVLAPNASAQGADLCSNATAISGTGTFSVNNQGANTDGPGACGNFGRDVWFAWTATATDVFQFDTCSFASYDTTLAAYSGSCGSLSQISCNDDTCGLQSSVSISAMQGTTYLIRVGGYSGAQGTATLTIDQGGPTPGCANPATGPDVIVGAIPNISNYGAVGNMGGYSLGTTSCNTGDAELLWIANNNQHPVIGQNIYRLEDGRFEQIGMSWLKHGFTALQQNLCCNCQSSGTGTRLGVGCSDPYGSGLNGSQGGLGPRFQVNAFTGAFQYPYAAQGQGGDRVYKRIQVPNDDVDPGLHPTAQYFGEAQYITPDDAAAGNGTNNVSYVPLNRPGSTTQGAWRLDIGGATERELPAIHAWQAQIPAVTIAEINVAGEGQFVAGSHAVDNGDGTWTYNYAIFNNTSDLSGQSFSVPVGANVTVSDVGMSFPHYHSGEPYTNVAWSSTVGAGAVTWETETYAQNVDANALRWGTTYSFWFTADSAPETKMASLGLFKPTMLGDQLVALEGPMDTSVGGPIVTSFCPANPNSTGSEGDLDATNIDLVGRTLELTATDLPPQQFGIFITSLDQGFVPNLAGGQGNLCVLNPGRGVGGAIFSTGLNGQMQATADLDMLPSPTAIVAVQPGETRFFQAWHRDFVLVPTSNLTSAVSVQFP